jgi:plasmid stabilization system protein ParE
VITRLTAAASADLADALDWYRSRQAGLDNRFLAAVDATLDELVKHPVVGTPVEGEIRRVLLRGFPYGIFYTTTGDEIVVIACMHGARDPKRWQARGAS